MNTNYDTADQVRDEEACPEEILSLYAAGYHIGQKESDNVNQDNRDRGIDQGTSQGYPVIMIRKRSRIVREAYKRLAAGYTVPAGKCQIQTINERNDHNTAEQYG